MTSPLARLFLRARRVSDPIFLHYSQPSIQVDWLLESIPDGSTWLRRFSSFEANNNRQANVRGGWLKALQDLGYCPQFISSEEVEAGKLSALDKAVLVLPTSWAVSEQGGGADAGFSPKHPTRHPLRWGSRTFRRAWKIAGRKSFRNTLCFGRSADGYLRCVRAKADASNQGCRRILG